MKKRNRRNRYRTLQANWRDTLLLLHQFQWALIFFGLAIIGGGALYFFLARAANTPVGDMPAAFYTVLLLTFLQPLGDFPRAWYLELFYFLMPVIGIVLLAQGAADFGVAFFNRRTRSKEWETAVASTFSNHVILVGLGHLGYRVVRTLYQMEQDVVVIEMNPSKSLINDIRKMNIPVLDDDGTREQALLAAGVTRARSIILCTQNDSINLQMALKARRLKPDIQVVVRIFDDEFASELQQQFGFLALSSTGMAAPAFAAAGAGIDISRPITVEGQPLILARLNISSPHPLEGKTVGQLESLYEVSIVLLRREGYSDFHPPAERFINDGDVIAALGSPDRINLLILEDSSA